MLMCRSAWHLSPVFLDGIVYFLDMNGRLGVVDLNVEKMEWKFLDKSKIN